MAELLDGRPLAREIREDTARRAAALAVPPRLDVVTATDDGASAWYVSSIRKAAAKEGLECRVHELGPDAAESAIRAELQALSVDPDVHGIILQTPLPAGVGAEEVAQEIEPAKDVDGANPLSLGRLAAGLPAFAPATAAAVIALLEHHRVPLSGCRTVVVGRSAVVGKPLAHLLLDRNATVTVCHSRTKDLAAATRTGEVVVAAAGRPALITAGHLAPGTIVVDVGTNPTPEGGLVGDVSPDAIEVAKAVTPVPGGVGPVTTALLLRQTVEAAEAAAAEAAAFG